jgi:CheY-like chemotaxis protein
MADPSQIDQVIVNLTLNARDAMPDGGRLTIAMEMAEVGEMFARRFPDMEPGRYVRVTVKDTGVGMDQQTRLRIFEPFFTTKQRGRGTGLGLASVYGIIQQSNGVIDVESTPGQGTCFLIYLPFVARSAQLLDAADAGQQPSRGWETVLVVEDEAPLRSLAVQFLREQGYAVLEAEAAEQALERAGQHPGPIHLLLTDVVMPGMNGIELAQRIAEARPETKVILMSGYIDDLASLENAPANGAGFLQKPFALSDLATKARKVLDAKT